MKKITGEKLVNLFLLLLSIFYLCYSKANYKLGTMRMPKEGFMPLLLGIGMVGLSAYLTVQAFLNKGDAQNVKFGISWKRFTRCCSARSATSSPRSCSSLPCSRSPISRA